MNDSSSSLVEYSNSSLSAISPAMVSPFGGTGADNDITGELYRCHLCSYSGTSKSHFNAHMNTHFDHKCQFCDYTSRTEGRLKRHIRDFHSEIPPESWAGNRVMKENGDNGESEESVDASESGAGVNGSGGNGKNRKYKCKQCPFVAVSKHDFWEHSKEHIKTEKLLTCPKCNFVTEYKHHLEYHLRNHFGSKPFKCAKCNYSCVNKSMLNSHMKSHSNIYQYRCADCSYATKYCHSLKLHLRKYQHKPATVLNLDGTPNPYPVIDVYGTRRGPRPKKSKGSKDNRKSDQFESSLPHKPLISSPLSPNMLSNTPIPPLVPTSMSPALPFLYQSSPALLHSGLLGVPAMSQMPKLPPNSHLNAESHPLYNSLTSDKPSNVDESIRFLEQMTVNPSFFNGLLAMQKNESAGHLGHGPLEWHSPRDMANPICFPIRPTIEAERNRPESAPIRPNSKSAVSPPPRSRSSPNDRFEAFEVQCSPMEDSSKEVESTPLDLSSNKSNSPISQPCEQKFNILSHHLNQLTESSILSHIFKQNQDKRSQDNDNESHDDQVNHDDNTSSNISNADLPMAGIGGMAKHSIEAQIPPQQTRAQRRKGRASKLNINRSFIKINDQSLNNVSEDESEETNDSLLEEPDVDNIITKINNATSLLQEILIDMYSLKNESYH